MCLNTIAASRQNGIVEAKWGPVTAYIGSKEVVVSDGKLVAPYRSGRYAVVRPEKDDWYFVWTPPTIQNTFQVFDGFQIHKETRLLGMHVQVGPTLGMLLPYTADNQSPNLTVTAAFPRSAIQAVGAKQGYDIADLVVDFMWLYMPGIEVESTLTGPAGFEIVWKRDERPFHSSPILCKDELMSAAWQMFNLKELPEDGWLGKTGDFTVEWRKVNG